MTICKRCGKENQDHFKFCLGCGGELSAAAAGPPAGAAMAKTVVADPGVLPRKGATPTPPGGVPAGVGSNQPPMGPAPMGGHPPFMGGPPTPFTPAPPSGPGWGPPGPAPLPGVATPRPTTPTPGAPSGPSPFGGAPAGGPGMGPGPMGPPPGAAPGPMSPPMGGSPFGGAGTAKPKSAAMPSSAPSPYSPPAPGFGSPPSPFGAGPSPIPAAPAPMGLPPTVPAPAHGGGAPSPGTTTRPCPNCGFEVPGNFMFCGACGQKLTPVSARASTGSTLQPSTVPDTRPRGRITLIRPDGTEGGSLDLDEGENKIGRQSGPLFENDGYLSPLHAELVINAAGAVVRDSNSLNGVFVKITGEEEVTPGDTFRIGQELIRFDMINAPAPLEDGTEIMGSPNPGYWGRLSVIIGKDIEGSAFPLLGDAVTMGRERGDINFPDDGYVSGLHARLTQRNGKFYLNDLGSSNGTFLKIRGERSLQNGSFVLLGQQLFRLNLT